MIPVKESREVHSSGVTDSVSFEISAKDSAHVMGILRDTLYSDKILAVLREYGSNAWDAMRESGKGDRPIRVSLPTDIAPDLRIRDDGPGLSHEDVLGIYSQYGASTKRGNNEAVGMLGIGSKSGFAYSDSFTVTSWHGGMKRTYVAVIDGSEKGRIDLLAEEPSADPAETGVEIQLAVRPQDIPAFEQRAKLLFAHFVPRPEINCELPPPPKGREFPGIGTILESEEGHHAPKDWFVVMGCVPYRVDRTQLAGGIDGEVLSTATTRIGGILPFGIGELQVAASREGLKYGDGTKLALIRRINALVAEYVRTFLEGFEDLTPWEQRLRIILMSNMQLPIPPEHKHLNERWADLIHVPKKSAIDGSVLPPTFTLKSVTRWDKKFHAARSVQVTRNARLVFKDCARTVQGYSWQDEDMVVIPTTGMDASALKDLRVCLDASHLRGIPIVMASALPWAAPPRGPGAIRDPEKARARCFLFDTSVGISMRQKSRMWAPASRVPTDEDVYVILESYVPQSPSASFYESYNELASNLRRFKLTMPPIVGYKTTEALPVNKGKLKGTQFGVWVQKGMLKLFTDDPVAGSLIQANAWAGLADTCYQPDSAAIEAELGSEHAISCIARRIAEGKRLIAKAPYDQVRVASSLRHLIGAEGLEAQVAWTRVRAAYPMLGLAGGLNALANANCATVLEYIKLVDERKRNIRPMDEIAEVLLADHTIDQRQEEMAS